MNINTLAELATKRSHTLFADDIQAHKDQLAERITGKRFLMIGSAGTIGSSTLRQVLSFKPASVTVVDVSENGLAALTRDLRTGTNLLDGVDFHVEPLDFGSQAMFRLIDESPKFDGVLNFAALKHVRSEKNVYSVLQMIDTNIVKQTRLLRHLAGKTDRVFVVSTDKAANPVNLMGATKRFMEEVTLGDLGDPFQTSSARFANVAFSNGSLLNSWMDRWAQGQPIPVPRDTQRYFVSPKESGEICLLAAFLIDNKKVAIPRTGEDIELEYLQDVAAEFVRAQGYEPRFTDDAAEALHSVDADKASGKYPVLLTPLDTTGEKPYEEFIGTSEVANECGFKELLALTREPLPSSAVQTALSYFENAVMDINAPASLEEVVNQFRAAVPSFNHIFSDKHLDQRI